MAQQIFESSDKTPLNNTSWVLYGRLNIWPSVLLQFLLLFLGMVQYFLRASTSNNATTLLYDDGVLLVSLLKMTLRTA